MADIELILGADNGANTADKLSQAYPKINRSLTSINNELAHFAALISALQTGDSGAAANAARYNSLTGIMHATLKARLDEEYQFVTGKVLGNSQAIIDLSVNKADKTEVNALATNKANQTDLDITNALLALKADQTQVDQRIAAVSSGSPKGVYPTLADLQAAYPTGNSGVFLVAADGKLYGWINSSWTAIVQYQSTGIADNSITPQKTTFARKSTNLFNKSTVTNNYVILANGELSYNTDYAVSDHILVTPSTTYFIYGGASVAEYDANNTFLVRYNLVSSTGMSYGTSPNTKFIRVNMLKNNPTYSTARVNLSADAGYEDYKSELINVKIKSEHITDLFIESFKRSTLGGIATIIPGTPNKLPNVDILNHKLEFYGNTYVCWNNTRHVLSSDTNAVITVDYSTVWNNGGLIPMVYFDTSTKTIRVYASNEINTVTENSVFLCAVYKKAENGVMSFVGLSSNFEYTVNGKSKFEQTAKVYPNIEDIPSGWFEAPATQGYEVDQITNSTISANDIYGPMNTLVSNNPSYITKTTLGNDATGVHPIYAYEFKPVDVANNFSTKRPKIIIVSGVHGEEKSSVVSLRNFLVEMCNNWRNNELLEFMRFNVHLIVVPIVNTYGFTHNTRKNGNGVDINRNSSFRWDTSTSSDPASVEYKGPAAFSEDEALYIRDIILSNKDAIAFYDYHTNGTSGDVYRTLFWHFIENFSDTDGYKRLNLISKNNITKLTRESQKRYSVPTEIDSGFVGYISYNHSLSTLAAFANSQGIPGATIECAMKLPGETMCYTARLMQLCTEYISNALINTMRVFSR